MSTIKNNSVYQCCGKYIQARNMHRHQNSKSHQKLWNALTRAKQLQETTKRYAQESQEMMQMSEAFSRQSIHILVSDMDETLKMSRIEANNKTIGQLHEYIKQRGDMIRDLVKEIEDEAKEIELKQANEADLDDEDAK